MLMHFVNTQKHHGIRQDLAHVVGRALWGTTCGEYIPKNILWTRLLAFAVAFDDAEPIVNYFIPANSKSDGILNAFSVCRRCAQAKSK